MALDRDALTAWLRQAFAADAVAIHRLETLTGGAIQENWRLDVELDGVKRSLVLRRDAPTVLTTSHSRAEEYRILQVAYEAGVLVPEPLALCEDTSVLGSAFFVMNRARGIAQARKITRDPALPQFGEPLVEQLGAELAKLHQVRPASGVLDFLDRPDQPASLSRIARYRADLDALSDGHPVLEYALNWLEDHAPQNTDVVLCHCDYRTGNFLVDQGQLTAVLDWEFATWSDPAEDIGWICARCWRFGNDAHTVGGLGSLDGFLRGYGRAMDRGLIRYWQVMAELRWAVIALQQSERATRGGETSLELALTARLVPEMEWNILDLIEAAS